MGRPATRTGHWFKQLPIPPDVGDAVSRYRHKIEAKSEVEAYLKLIEAGLDAHSPGWRRWKRKKEGTDE